MQSQTHVDQVGGNHYDAEYQHWDFVEDHNIPYLEACATKYVSRWQKKGGAQDLEKAISYIEKRLKKYQSSSDSQMICGNRYWHVSVLKMIKWFDSVEMEDEERSICTLLFCWEKPADLQMAINLIKALIKSTEPIRNPGM